jgi:transposase
VATSLKTRATAKPTRQTRRVAPRRDFEGMKERRLRAADMFRRGKSQADVAAALGVSRTAAWQWHKTWTEGGRAALSGAGRAGRLPWLDDSQLQSVLDQLMKGPEANGYDNGLWTLARVAEVIKSVTGVSYSTSGTWKLLRERLEWSRQRPARRALERDDQAIIDWAQKDWPRIKKAPGAGRRGSSSPTRAG